MTATDWRISLWAYPWDVIDESPASVVRAAERASATELNLAVSYHSGMFLLPHNPRRKLYYPMPSIYFTPDTSRYSGLRIQPIVNELAQEDVVGSLQRQAATAHIGVNAWIVCLHSTGLGERYPDLTNVNAFGDRHRSHLCAANPDVRAYMKALLGDIAQREFGAILVESLDYQMFSHGYHHEVVGVPLTPFISYLLGLCFCEHCLREARADGVDGEEVKRFVRDELNAYFDGEDERGRSGASWSDIRRLAAGSLGAYQDMRKDVVTQLYEEVRATWPQGQSPKLEIIDFGPFRKLGWDESAEESGLDLQAVSPFVDGAHPCLYFPTPQQVSTAAQTYRDITPAKWSMLPVIRAITPQTTTETDLKEQVLACNPGLVDGYGFYNFGFMRMQTLDWIRSAVLDAKAQR